MIKVYFTLSKKNFHHQITREAFNFRYSSLYLLYLKKVHLDSEFSPEFHDRWKSLFTKYSPTSQ